MLFLLFLLVSNTFFSQAAILECDFETSCNDFSTDSNWGLTNGLNPQPIDHDHTLDNSSGHYIFYNPQDTGFQIAEIKTSDWLELSNNRTVCFRMWYYTPRINLPFYIQLIQGDDEQLIRVIDSIIGKDPSTNDWALVNITLPSEKFKIAIRLNTTGRPLAFDDISVDYCDESHPPPPSKVLYQCNFESSCSDDFVSLPAYPYQWSILKASDAIQIENQAPKTDYTFDNSSGHYAILPNSKQFVKGKVGYLHLQSELNITSEESYCLNLYYYAFGRSYASDLNVYLQLSNESKIIQRIWPLRPGSYYTYNRNQWTWGIINLPIGEYTLLFRADSTDVIPLSFALDNIAILSCAYPSTERSSYENLLSFSCTFDDLTMCNMINDADTSVSSRFNFTVFNGETLPDKELGPSRDHTTNSTTGGFLYWNRNLPFTAKDVGRVYQSTSIAQNLGMCVKFSYYVKSATVRKNGTQISLSAGGCYGASLWFGHWTIVKVGKQ
ncbi:hypothetical protein I4U23_019838 [Adineta vaga]|nr:hypothetical protein I4U23_019838 [Adineta vaga]